MAKVEKPSKKNERPHITQNDAENLVLHLVLPGLQTLHERQTSRKQRSELLGQNGQLPERQLVRLGLAFERLNLRPIPGGFEALFLRGRSRARCRTRRA